MMILSVKINNETTYRLSKWDAQKFKEDLTLYIQSADFAAVTADFAEIETIEILIDDVTVAVYRSFDQYGSISYMGKLYVEGEKKFTETFAVTLTKANIIEIIERIDGAAPPEENTDMDEFLNIVYTGE